MNEGLEKNEIKYLIISVIILILLLLVINITLIREYIENNFSPILQFMLFNVGLYMVYVFLIKFLANGKHGVFKGGLATVLTTISLDLILPEYHVSLDGLTKGGIFGASATDYFFGYVYNTFLGIQGLWLVIMVYIVTFVILFVSGAMLFKNFLGEE